MEFIKIKQCCICGMIRLRFEFKESEWNRKSGSGRCRVCLRQYSKLYKRQHREKTIRAHRIYNHLHREDINKRRKLYSQQHPQEKHAEYVKYRTAHMDIVRRCRRRANHNRRARKLQSIGTYTRIEWESLCNQYDNRCLCCGERLPLTVDHVVPLSKNGTNFISNIQPLCKPCNSKKGTKVIDFRPNPFPNQAEVLR